MTLKQECINFANGRYKVEFNWSIFAEYCGLNQTLLHFYRDSKMDNQQKKRHDMKFDYFPLHIQY